MPHDDLGVDRIAIAGLPCFGLRETDAHVHARQLRSWFMPVIMGGDRRLGRKAMTEGGMNKVRLGRTGLTVTPLCFGASGLGDMPDTYGYDVDAERAKATVRAIFDGPANFLDTSRIYGFGRSEERIGAVIRERGGLPKGFVLSTKLDRDPNTGRFDAARARRSLEQSLAALGVDKIDLLHLHDPEHGASLSEITGPNGAIAELFKIKEQGLAKAVGL